MPNTIAGQTRAFTTSTSAQEPFAASALTPDPYRAGVILECPSTNAANVFVYLHDTINDTYTVPSYEVVPGQTVVINSQQLFKLKAAGGTPVVNIAEYREVGV